LNSTQPQTEKGESSKQKKESPLLNLMLNILIPTIIMMKFSKAEYLGQVNGLILALAFPLGYGIYDHIKSSKVNGFSLIGLFSILITGGIGLFELDRTWMIVKETAIPLIVGIVVIASEKTSKPLVRSFLGQMIDLDMIASAYEEKGLSDLLKGRLRNSTYMLASTFLVSAILNFVLAVYVLEGNPGTEEFVESLGKMTFLSFPVITVPTMLMVGFILYYLFNGIKKETDLEIEDVFRQ
jgi:hypothetical protein